MINHPAARARLAELVDHADATTYATTPAALTAFPAILIGMPRLTPRVGPCLDRSEWPIAVVVKNDAVTGPGQLEDLWPQVWDQLDAAIAADPYLDGACEGARLERAEFGAFRVQGHEYPAQVITISLDG